MWLSIIEDNTRKTRRKLGIDTKLDVKRVDELINAIFVNIPKLLNKGIHTAILTVVRIGSSNIE